MNYQYYNIDLCITIGNNLRFNVCKSIHIESSVQVLSNSAKLELPREFRNAVAAAGKSINLSGKSILDFIKRGDAIKIELGYDGDLQREFEGYITKIGAEMPLLLECEDEMFQLKKAARITKFIKSGKLIDILKAVIPAKYTIEMVGDYEFSNWLIDDKTPFEVLEEIIEKIPFLRFYFKNPTSICVGAKVDFEAKTVHDFNFSENVRRGSSLKFENKADSKFIAIAKSKQAKGKFLTATTGEKGGDEKTITFDPGLTLKQLQNYADTMYKSQKKDGFTGSLESWCYPRTKPGDAAQLHRPFYEDRHQDGRYFIESVTIDVNGSDGIKRTNTLSHRL